MRCSLPDLFIVLFMIVVNLAACQLCTMRSIFKCTQIFKSIYWEMSYDCGYGYGKLMVLNSCVFDSQENNNVIMFEFMINQ